MSRRRYQPTQVALVSKQALVYGLCCGCIEPDGAVALMRTGLQKFDIRIAAGTKAVRCRLTLEGMKLRRDWNRFHMERCMTSC
jgi:hypothetical protein